MKRSNPKILGIDPGLNFTGHATLWDMSSRRLLDSTGLLAASSDWTFEARLNAQTASIEALIEHKDPDVLALELYNYQGSRSHSQNAFWLSRLVGRIETMAKQFDCVLVGVNKQDANSALGLKRNQKVTAERIRKVVDSMFPQKQITEETIEDQAFTVASKSRPRSDHEIDAVAVAVAGAQRWRGVQRLAGSMKVQRA